MEMDSFLEVKKSDPNSSYTCTSCGKVCVNWRAYVYHQKSRHSETDGKKFSCNICGRQFYTKHRLKKHATGHQKGKHHCCQVCGKLFESHKKLTVHSLVHNLSSMHDQNLQCGDCGRTYSDWIPFKQHMKTHGTEGVCYACGICEETFATQYDLEKHRRVHKQFQCEFCDRYFRSASVLSVHLRIHTGERPYHCGLCNRDFSQSCVLKVHMRTHAKEGRYECKACGLVLHDVMEYFQHHISHLEAGNLQCEECGKMFDNINNKNRHMATHRDRDCHHCHVCGKEFGRVSHLEAHMLSHSELDPTPLTCKVCSKTFSSQDLLTAHYSSHMTGDASSSSEAVLSGAAHSSPMFCGVCGKMFKDREYLNKHMRKHDKEAQKAIKFEKFIDEDVVKVENGQFACVDCGKAFGKLDHLTVHRREHTGECPHSCCMCGQSFMLRSQLLKHIREHRQSGVMMYLNLDAGEVCATTMSDSDIKDVIKFTSAGTETKGLDGETSSKIKSTSVRPESLHQLQPSTQSQNDGKPEEYYQNQPEAAKSSCNTETIQYNFPLRNQIPPHDLRVNSQDDRYHHQHHHHHPSTQNNTSLRSGSISLDIQTPVPPSMAHSQHPMSHKDQELVSSADPHVLRASNFEAMSSSAHSIPITRNVNLAYSTPVKEGSFLFSPHELAMPLVCSNQIAAPVSQNTILPRGNNGHLQQHQQPQQQVDNNRMVISSEQPLALVTMDLSSNPPLIPNPNPKSNSSSSHDSSSLLSVVSHHALPRVYVSSSPTTVSVSNNNNNNNNVVLPAAHQPHPHLSVSVSAAAAAAANAHAAHGHAGGRFINPDLHHSLVSHFQLLPQTAFPENSQHM